MQLDYDVRSCSRVCSETGRALGPGDVYFSVLVEDQDQLVRHDFSTEAWAGAPEECLAWWRSRLPDNENMAPKLAPAEVLLNLFVALEDRPQEASLRYLLGLLLLRRRVLRKEESLADDSGQELLSVSCPRRNEQYRMFDLLYGDSEPLELDDPEPQDEESS